jgi:cell division protein FtsW
MITTMMMFGFIAHAALREPEALVSMNSGGGRWMRAVFGRPANPRPSRPARRARGERALADSGRTARQSQERPRARQRSVNERLSDQWERSTRSQR